jgi:hypothetical protein
MIGLCRSVFAQASTRLHQRVGKAGNFFDTAADRVELCAPEMVEGSACKILGGQLERVQAAPFGRSHEVEIEVALGAPRLAQPTSMYVFKDVTIAKNRFISANRYETLGWPKSEWAFTSPERIDRAVLVNSIQGTRYFGHWLRDDCATSLLFPAASNLVAPAREPWTDEQFYVDLLDQKPAKTITHARIGELIYFDDLANNSHKLPRFISHRARIRKKCRPIKSHDIVYISRGPSARGRVIDNEADLIRTLEARGVKIVVSQGLQTASFFDEILDANLIISAEGSQCAHALYALRDKAAGLITLQPHDRFYLPHLEWVRLLGFESGAVVSDAQRGNFWIDPSEVLRTIDLF